MGSVSDLIKTAGTGSFMAGFSSLHAIGSTEIATGSAHVFLGGFGSLLTPGSSFS